MWCGVVAWCPVATLFVNVVALSVVTEFGFVAILFAGCFLALPAGLLCVLTFSTKRKCPGMVHLLASVGAIAASEILIWWAFISTDMGANDAQGALVFIFAPIFAMAAGGYGGALGFGIGWLVHRWLSP